MLFLCVSISMPAPRTCQVPKTPKSDQGRVMKREKWKADERNYVRGGGVQ